ncbi:hypothetical protein Tco_1485406 [Tanacetum coccineum]
MANLKYSDKHNMVAFLKKPNESVGFTEVVDFLKGTSLRSYEAPLPEEGESLETAFEDEIKCVIVSESESEELEDQGRKFQDINDDPLVSLVRESMKEKSTDFVTPTKASREAHEEEISPTILEAAKTFQRIASGC